MHAHITFVIQKTHDSNRYLWTNTHAHTHSKIYITQTVMTLSRVIFTQKGVLSAIILKVSNTIVSIITYVYDHFYYNYCSNVNNKL